MGTEIICIFTQFIPLPAFHISFSRYDDGGLLLKLAFFPVNSKGPIAAPSLATKR